MHTNAQAGALSCFIIACMYILCKIVELIWPADAIEDCPTFAAKAPDGTAVPTLIIF